MGKFGLFNTDREDRMFQLLFVENKSLSETGEILEKENMSVTRTELAQFKDHAFRVMRENDQSEKISSYLYDSIDKVKVLLEDLNEKTMELVDSAEDDATKLQAIKEVREQLKLVMMKHGELQKGMSVINHGTIINDSNVVMMLRDMQTKWFDDMGAELVDGKIVFNSPSPEMIENFKNWEKNQPKIPIGEFKVVD